MSGKYSFTKASEEVSIAQWLCPTSPNTHFEDLQKTSIQKSGSSEGGVLEVARTLTLVLAAIHLPTRSPREDTSMPGSE